MLLETGFIRLGGLLDLIGRAHQVITLAAGNLPLALDRFVGTLSFHGY